MGESYEGAAYSAEQVPAERFLREHPQPVVLSFQPRTFAVLEDPEDLRRWEADLVECVGLPVTLERAIVDAIAANGGTSSESGCGASADSDID